MTYGSLGDLHPYIALALGMQRRGHQVTIATSELYRARVEPLGIAFHAVRPNITDFPDTEALYRQGMHPRTGAEFVVRRLIMPHLRASYTDVLAAAQDADLMVTHSVLYAAPLVAEKTGVRWVSTVLSPLPLFSAYDPPTLSEAPWLQRLRGLGPGFFRLVVWAVKTHVRSWGEPVRRLRAEIGLPPSNRDPLFEATHSPQGVLALFSSVLAAPQPDWPPNTRVTGFPFYDGQGDARLNAELEAFLAAGEPPIVFTLGSAAIMDAGDFYAASAQVAGRLGRRAVLLIGGGRNLPSEPMPPGVVAFDYAPYSLLFPRAAAVVHQGGIGATGQCLRAGCPMLVTPHSFDQPDNAARVARLGVARAFPRARYTVERAASELRLLLDTPRYAARAAEIRRIIEAEDGVHAACAALDEHLSF